MTRRSIAIAALVAGACGGDSQPGAGAADSPDDFGDAWLTEPEFEFGEGIGGSEEASFSLISSVRVLEGGERILVAEAASVRVTIWTREGLLLREVGGPGEGPGEFTGTLFVETHREGFRTRDARRYSSFSSDGTLIATVPYPPRELSFRGFPLWPEALLHDGSFLVTPRVPPEVLVGLGGDEPIEDVPVYHVSAEGDDWTLETIAMLDTRNRHMFIRPQGTRFAERGIRVSQSYGDFDLTWFDPDAGGVVVLRRNRGGGTVELMEIGVAADTLWRRQVSTSPVTLAPATLATFIDRVARQYAEFGGGEERPAAIEAIREAIEEAIHVPDPLPGATRLFGSNSDEIWFQGYQRRDTLSLWHAVRRDGTGGRRVLLPTGFRAMDATDSHVWGVHPDELGVEYVVGRRLVSAPTAGGGAPGQGTGMQAGREDTWTARPAQALEVPGGVTAGNGSSARLRIGANGTRIVIVTGSLLRRLDWRLSVWTPDAALMLATETSEMAEGLTLPSGLSAGAEGFRLRHSDRSVWYAYDDARTLRTMFPPSGLERLIPLEGGGLLGFGRIPGWFNSGGVKPETRAIIHARRIGEGWKQDTIGFRDIRHNGWFVQLPPDPSQPDVLVEISGPPQPFAAGDLAVIDAGAGSVFVVRRNQAPGTAEITELLASGDTAWHRRLVLEVMPLAPEQAEDIIEARLTEREADGAAWLGRPDARSVIKDAIYVPSHLPSVSRMVVAASREVWLRTPREEDGMVVWHSIARGDEDGESRRVLLPATFQLQDAFGDHVWGFSTSDDGTRTAVWLQLVPPEASPPA